MDQGALDLDHLDQRVRLAAFAFLAEQTQLHNEVLLYAILQYLVAHTVNLKEIEHLTGLDLLPTLDVESVKKVVASELWSRNLTWNWLRDGTISRSRPDSRVGSGRS